ncbi:MAG: UvrD-helicase domain-containing protein [Candidatus Pacebacteria bacterium]|nr:UvrD-helicase domain-containing protein [Candidatus Paceibacterota bacterium]
MTKITLNKQQKKASDILSGPVLILAGAGAGKTMTLTARIVKLIESGIMPQNILAITFTNKAAGEMRDRVLSAISKNSKINFPTLEIGMIPFVSTFHSLGVFIIRDNYQKLDVSKYFSIYDRNDTKKALKEALQKLDFDPKEWDIKNLISIISKNKGNFIDNEIFYKNSENNFYTKNVAKIWNKYEEIKKEDKSLDFDDLLLKTAQLLNNDENIKNHYLKKWSHIHIDEYQDTNNVQNKIIELLINPETKNVFAVGDDDQSVYGWRGSNIKNILEFENKHKANKIFMEQNYRSTKNIIEASNSVIEKNSERYPKKLFTKSPAGEKIFLYSAFSEKEEARYIADQIKERLKKNITENDIAILYRANFQSRILEEAMLRENIPYQVLGTKFFDRTEVKDIMSYIKASVNPKSLIDLKRIINSPKRGIGKTSVLKIFSGDTENLTAKAKISYNELTQILQKIQKFSKENTTSELIKFTINESGFEKIFLAQKTEEANERLANMYELALFAEKYDHLKPEDGLLKLLEDVALISDTDSKKDNKKNPMVKLMTIHSSKGLEFDTIFLTGAEEAFFSPIENGDKKKEKEKLEEERRLFYVAMTRAKTILFISWANMRTIYGKTEQNIICPFVLDIPQNLLEEKSTFANFKEENDGTEYLEW